jgi:hypothetical protein
MKSISRPPNITIEQELSTFPENLSSPPVFSGVRVTRSIVLCVCFVDRCLCFCPFSFGHCIVCPSSMCGFWLPLWYLQTLLYFMCMFCISLFVLLHFFFWPLCCLSFDLQILITLWYVQTLLTNDVSWIRVFCFNKRRIVL